MPRKKDALQQISDNYDQVIVASGSVSKIDAAITTYLWFSGGMDFRDPETMYGVKESRSRDPLEVAKGKREVVYTNLKDEEHRSLIHSGDVISVALVGESRKPMNLSKPVASNPELQHNPLLREQFALEVEDQFSEKNLGFLWIAAMELYGNTPELPLSMGVAVRIRANFGVLPRELIGYQARRENSIKDASRIGGIELAQDLGIPVYANSPYAPYATDVEISHDFARSLIIGNAISGDIFEETVEKAMKRKDTSNTKIPLDFKRYRV